ncbi:hypothetical protein PG630_01525 [Riemerella anatipestifer]|nr:hypothetical protein [Riemerella anatipestifer]
MKKITILALALGTCSIAQAQVLSHGEISKNLFKTNYFLDASNFQSQADVSKGKLLGFPQTDLTQFKFDLKVVTDEVTLSGFDGVVVYNTATGKTGSDANTQGKVVDVTPGFYYFSNPNGATNQTVSEGKWVRLSDTQANDQLWAQRDNNGVTETYLKPADAKGDFVGYKSGRTFNLQLGSFSPEDLSWFHLNNTSTTGYDSAIPQTKIISSEVLPTLGKGSDNRHFWFNQDNFILKQDHFDRNKLTENRYYGNETRLVNKDITSPVNETIAFHASNDFFSNTTATTVIGLSGLSTIGSQNKTYTPTATNQYASLHTSRNHGKVINQTVIRAYNDNLGTVDNIRGLYNTISSQNSIGTDPRPAHTVKTMYGVDNVVTVSENATIETESVGVRNRNYIDANTIVPLHIGIRNYSVLDQNAKVTKLVGEQMSFYTNTSSNVTEQYGLMIDNINKGTTKNYAIYTNAGTVRFGDNVGIDVDTPIEKLEVAGNILAKEAGLRSERSSDIGGSLELSNTLKTDATTEVGKWRLYNMKTGGTYNYISGLHFWAYGQDNSNKNSKMVLTDEGKLAIGYGSNASAMPKITELLNVNGKVKATAFIGTNGASIFPDYVFQKYYTGTSSIKADYSFKTLSQVENFVKANGHLPGYQSAEAIKKQGYIDLMATQLTNVEKIEELYLHSIEQDKALKAQKEELKSKDAKIAELEARLQKLEALLVK